MGDIKERTNLEFGIGEKHAIINKGPRFGMRYVQTLLMFWCVAIGYAMRVNLSVGIVAMTTDDTSPNPDIPTYNWDNKSIVLSSFFMGYICLQVFAGELGKRYGPKWFLVGSMAINSVGSMLTPLMAKAFGSYGVMAIRILQGLFQGFIFPSVHNILGKWAPEEERSTLGNIIFAGIAFGTIIAMPVTGVIAGSWAGWPAAFYLFGSVGFVWCFIFSIFGSNNPAEHRSITPEEKFYIESSLKTDNKAPPKTPWKAILTSMPFWAIVIAGIGQNWGYSALLTEISTYLNKVCNQNISSSSILSAAPYLALFILGLVFGPIADWIIAKKYLTTRNTRKLMHTIGCVSAAAALTVLALITTDSVTIIETLLIIAVGMNASVLCGYQVNHVDLSPKFSGVLMGMANLVSHTFSIISPLAVQFMVTDETDPLQWRVVFLLASAIYIASDIFYIIFAKAERQWWDNTEDESNELSGTVTAANSPNGNEESRSHN